MSEYKLPEAIDSKGDSYSERAYAEGWNACRAAAIAAIEAQGVPDVDDLRDRLVAISSAVAELEQQLEALRKDAGWRPIETAPDSMSEIVVVRFVNSDGEECHEFDYREDGCWIRWHEHAEHIEVIGGHGVSYTPPYKHWMPLPPKPDAAKEQR